MSDKMIERLEAMKKRYLEIDKMMEESYYKFTKTCKYCLRGSKLGVNKTQGS